LKRAKKNRWSDHYTRRAKKEKYAARSVYKLEEIQKKYKIIRKGDRVLDLGCAPGSWLQFAAEQTGPGGTVLGVDLKPVTIRLPDHVQVHTGDIHDLMAHDTSALGSGFCAVLSDMAPATSGNKHADAVRSLVLCETALEVAGAVLRPGGHFVCKIFQGEDFKAFCDKVKGLFERMHIYKPQSSRKASKEIFVIGISKKIE
jgi:23S rRNA (uridine2552-2'-O)-methyltransferase